MLKDLLKRRIVSPLAGTARRLDRAQEVEFVTMVWFESFEAVQSFAGENYDTPVISEKARRLLSRYQDRCDHYELSSFQFLGSPKP